MSLILDFSRIRENARRTPQHERFHLRALAAADWMLAYPIPPALDSGPPDMLKAVPPPPGVTPFSTDYLIAHEAYEVATFAYLRAAAQLPFAFHATGHVDFAQRAVAWVEQFVRDMPHWGPQASGTDTFMPRAMCATALACDWLGDALPLSLREQARLRVEQALDQCAGEWGAGIARPQPEHVNNHWWYNLSLAGIAGLWLGRRDFALRLGEHFEQLIPLSIGPDGDYIDKPGYLMWAYRWAFPFWLALEQAGGPRLLDHPRVGASARWLVAMQAPGDLGWVDWPRGFNYPWLYLLLAARHRLPAVQWMGLALRERMSIRHDHAWIDVMCAGAEMNGQVYDESLPAIHPREDGQLRTRHYRATGWAALRETWDDHSVSAFLYAGPASGKNYHDQGQVTLLAYGQRVLGLPLLPFDNYLSAHAAAPFTMSNQSGYVAEVDGAGQASGHYPNESPLVAEIGALARPPLARLTAVQSANGVHWASADLAAAYQDFSCEGLWGRPVQAPPAWAGLRKNRLARFERRIALVDGVWLVIVDHLQSHPGQPVRISLRHTTVEMRVSQAAAHVDLAGDLAKARLWWWSDQPAALTVAPWHHSELGRMLRLNVTSPVGQLNVIWALQITRPEAGFAPAPAAAGALPDALQLGARRLILPSHSET